MTGTTISKCEYNSYLDFHDSFKVNGVQLREEQCLVQPFLKFFQFARVFENIFIACHKMVQSQQIVDGHFYQVDQNDKGNGVQNHDGIIRVIANVLSLRMKGFTKVFEILFVEFDEQLVIPVNYCAKNVELKQW